MSTAVMPQTTTDLELLESLEFDPEHECEHANHGKTPWHGGPAKYLIRAQGADCPRCRRSLSGTHYALCKPAWDHAGTAGVRCAITDCDHLFQRHEVWTIIAEFK